MSDIGKGDWVIVIRADEAGVILPALGVGQVFCVEAIDEDPSDPCHYCGVDGPGVILCGVGHSKHETYCPCLFAPLRKPPESKTYLEEMREHVAAVGVEIRRLAKEIYK